MKVIMLIVSSVNGKITNGENPYIYGWTSKEDQDLFFNIISEAKLLVMGSKTYDAAKKIMKLSESTLRVVVTQDPERYSSEEVKGQLEFTSETPKEIENRFGSTYDQMILLGGGKLNSSFLKNNLVDEIHLTVEPLIFGKGKSLIDEVDLEKDLNLISFEKLNDRGTLLLKYKVEK